jgi:prepilin-type N-terminal cleavage/methylation domain-containing protein
MPCGEPEEEMSMRRDQKGFTLMELMVVIVIVAILAAVAVPLYINYVQDAQRSEARGAIGAIITAEQAFLQRNFGLNTYADLPTLQQQGLVDITEADINWDFTVLNPNQQGYIIEAVGTGGNAAGLGVRYTYTRAGGGVFTDFTPGAP